MKLASSGGRVMESFSADCISRTPFIAFAGPESSRTHSKRYFAGSGGHPPVKRAGQQQHERQPPQKAALAGQREQLD